MRLDGHVKLRKVPWIPIFVKLARARPNFPMIQLRRL